ncbi:MAG: SEC-C metal-binding domain-containing protein, partial [Butyricicoccus sp.]
IATNMAGRGTDIMLGGNAEFMAKEQLQKAGYPEEIIVEATGHADTDNAEILEARNKFSEYYKKFKEETDADAEKVRAAGGLYILGTERHESRRIDNQLRGRAGRQGDPGESSFYISMEDDLMRLFGSERIQNMMDSLGLEDDEPIDQKILSGAIENAQKKVESRNFATRKHVLEYDDVMNKQREIIYGQRLKVLAGEDVSTSIMSMIDDTIDKAVEGAIGEHQMVTEEMIEQIRRRFLGLFLGLEDFKFTPEELDDLTPDQIKNQLKDRAHEVYAAKEQMLGSPIMRELERVVLLRNVDSKWMDHIDAMTELRNGIGLRAYGQYDPVVEYKREGFDMFDAMIDSIREDTVRTIYLAQVRTREEPKREQVAKETAASGADDGSVKKAPVRKAKKIGPNDPCPCGSGKKYKKCCYLKQNPNS